MPAWILGRRARVKTALETDGLRRPATPIATWIANRRASDSAISLPELAEKAELEQPLDIIAVGFVLVWRVLFKQVLMVCDY